ncbi:hydroxyethylthiazole kinase [Rhodovibrionaceae bacterium A322]
MTPVQTLQTLRGRAPLIHCLTNGVALETTANLLLALGGRPVMADAVEEVAEVTASAQGLLVNLGMFSLQKRLAAEKAAEKAQALSLPWVLDPVGVGATELRREAALRLLRFQPTVIRGNASEIAALAQGGRMSGVDSSQTPHGVQASAQSLAQETGAVVAVTGEEDLVTDGKSIYRVAGGHTFFTRMTGAGCALSALVAAVLTVEEDPLQATVSTLAYYGLAGQIVGGQATGPGSFKTAFVDQIFFLDQVAEGCGDLIRKVV